MATKDKTWTDGWITGAMAMLCLMSAGGRDARWTELRDEYLAKAHPDKFPLPGPR